MPAVYFLRQIIEMLRVFSTILRQKIHCTSLSDENESFMAESTPEMHNHKLRKMQIPDAVV